ncbi:MAG: radical SAM protein [Chlamydiae bacterium]|nr:radical SAM protein [Chlamydiota bacterium]
MGVPIFQEVHIESTNACGYKCVMCPREELHRQIGYMSLEDFSLLLERIGPFSGSIHLHGFGEALLDRNFQAKVSLLSDQQPKAKSIVFSTLGMRLQENFFSAIIDAGLHTLAISLYGFTEDEYARAHGRRSFSLVKNNLLLLSQAMRSRSSHFSAYIKIPGERVISTLPLFSSTQVSAKQDFCAWAEDLGFTLREWSYVHNYGDGRQYNAPGKTLCPVIQGKRKGILNIAWNLDVLPCAYDFNGTIRFGNLRQQSLEEIFTGEAYLSFLLAHMSYELSGYKVCQNCEKADYE